jgi:hypothetical protein
MSYTASLVYILCVVGIGILWFVDIHVIFRHRLATKGLHVHTQHQHVNATSHCLRDSPWLMSCVRCFDTGNAFAGQFLLSRLRSHVTEFDQEVGLQDMRQSISNTRGLLGKPISISKHSCQAELTGK